MFHDTQKPLSEEIELRLQIDFKIENKISMFLFIWFFDFF